jgi:hypothetical protein
MIEIKAPQPYDNIDHVLPRIFLAGSIEMGVAATRRAIVRAAAEIGKNMELTK